jgi:hypothetical protein
MTSQLYSRFSIVWTHGITCPYAQNTLPMTSSGELNPAYHYTHNFLLVLLLFPTFKYNPHHCLPKQCVCSLPYKVGLEAVTICIQHNRLDHLEDPYVKRIAVLHTECQGVDWIKLAQKSPLEGSFKYCSPPLTAARNFVF